ncbi:MAG: hypothetical protein HYV39_01020 [Candidatus Levybacteria bacterium]|nr:hypothetical protein [Candidatus Levybacteria bacterium]
MTATGHAIIGTIIAAKVGNPYLAVPLALASHVAADIIPHWDTATNRKSKGKDRVLTETIFDIALGFLLSYAILTFFFPNTNFLYALLMIFVSQSFDWLMAPYYFFHINMPPFTWAYQLQKKFDSELDAPWGIVTQVAAVLVVLFLAVLL